MFQYFTMLVGIDIKKNVVLKKVYKIITKQILKYL